VSWIVDLASRRPMEATSHRSVSCAAQGDYLVEDEIESVVRSIRVRRRTG
jgi:hypothetical protein